MQPEAGLPGGSADAGTTMDYEESHSLSLDPGAGAADGLQHKVPSPAQQADEIEAAEAKDISEGEQMYLVSEGWWAQWCAYTRYKQPPAAEGDAADAAGSDSPEVPPPIDNSDIVYDSKLRDNLEEGRDFVIVTADSWSLLHRWYGGGASITRTAVMEGLAPHSKRPRVMLYPMRLEVCWGGKPNEVKTIEAEKHETVQSLKERACAAFGLEPSKVEIWDYFNHGKYANLEKDKDKDLEAARILDEQPILLDDVDNPLPESNTTTSSPIMAGCGRPARAASFAEDQTIQREGGRPGLVGLTNLGNTCFMNSSLQCLMHAVPILRLFLSGSYEGDINTTNPLGLKGQLALALGNLMNSVWRAGVGSVSPRAFKAKIAAFAPQFSGYQQHDSQEFLAFLLDGLHEDINRIQQKPYIEEPDSEGVPDAQLAATAWTNHRLRNDSAIVDHFQGLYKSTLVCPDCGYSSVKFDPFMYLSLPLPESRVKALTAILLHADGAAPPREYGLEVPQSGTLKDLYVALARVAGLPPLTAPGQQMVAAKLGTHFGVSLNTLEDASQRISELGRDSRDEVLLVYYYRDPEDGPGGRGGDNRKVVVVHRHPGAGHGGGRKFSAPLLLWLPPGETYDPQLHVKRLGGSSGSGSTKQLFGSGGGRLVGHGSDTEYAVTEDAPIWQHVSRMLQPFQAPVPLWQQPVAPAAPAAAAAAAGGEAGEAAAAAAAAGGSGSQDAAEQQQQQQPAVSAGPADVSMAAAVSAVPPSPSPEPCCTSSQPAAAAPTAAATAAGVARGGGGGSSGGAWGSDGGAADQTNNKAASEAGDNNSTWGSHGSEAGAHSTDMDAELGCEEALLDEGGAAIGISRAASAQQLAGGADGGEEAGDDAAVPAAAAGGGSADMESDGEVDASAALAAQQLAGGTDGQDAAAAAAAAAAGGGGSGGGGALGSRGVPVAPLDIWSAQTQAADAGGFAAADSLAAGTPNQQQQQEQQQEPPSGMAPYYQLKLAQDSGGTHVQSWYANQFHPNIHHSTFVLDWHKGAAAHVSHDQYLAACEASQLVPQQQEQQQQQEQAAEQQQQGDVQQQPQQQQQEGQPSAAVGAAAAAAGEDGPPVPFWLPDAKDDDSNRAANEAGHLILGRYVMSAMEQPQHDPSVLPIHAARSDPRGKVVSLEDCVEAFLQPEQLSEADEWYCPKCKTHVQADKKLDLWRLPEVLVVHLKRFSYTRWNRDKLDTQVKFPLQGLDLSSYVLGCRQQQPDGSTDPSSSSSSSTGAPLYDCFAVSNHYGGLGGGHYTAFAQMPDDKQWYLFDDSRVEETAPEGVQSRAAYLLFYRQRSAAAADPPDLVPQLLEARQQHLAAKAAAAEAEQQAAAAAAAAAAADGLAAVDGGSEPDAVAVEGEPASPTAAAAAGFGQSLALIPAAGSPPPAKGWESPVLGTPAGAAAAAAGEEEELLAGAGSPAPAPPAPAPVQPGGGAGRAGSGRRMGGFEDSSDTSTSRRNTGGLEEGDSSDGSSSSRPRGRGAGQVQRQRAAAAAQEAAEAVDSWGPLQGGGGSGSAAAASGQQPRSARQSDQDVGDADMADRDA